MHTIDLVGNRASGGEIPDSHRDLAECPPVAALTTLGSDGYPQTSVVWCDFDGECVMREPLLPGRRRAGVVRRG